MRRVILSIGIVLIMICVYGCIGAPDIQETTIQLNVSNEIKYTIYEDFTDASYNVDELNEVVGESVLSYNKSVGEERITYDDAIMEGDRVKLVMYYKSPEDYSTYNRSELLLLTPEAAYTLTGNKQELFNELDNPNEHIAWSDILVMEGIVVISTHEKVRIDLPKNVLYVSDGVELIAGKKSIRTSGDKESYVIYKP